MGEPIDSGNWRAEARQLRAQGKAADEIAARLGRAPEAIRVALRGTLRAPPPVFGAGARLIEAHAPRVPRTILDRQALPSAAAAFAKGEIDRAELMRRITVTDGARGVRFRLVTLALPGSISAR